MGKMAEAIEVAIIQSWASMLWDHIVPGCFWEFNDPYLPNLGLPYWGA
jgi:hypothetical protein